MQLLKKLWNDEAGVLLSAEAAVVGTVGVIGLTAGLSTVSSAVNEELKDVSMAIRSLDQSYTIPAMQGCGACTAGSSFTQEPVAVSLKKLEAEYKRAEEKERAAVRATEKSQQDRLKEQVKKQEQANKPNEKKKKRKAAPRSN